MCRLRDELLFILQMLNQIGSKCDVTPSTTFHGSLEYYPGLLDMRKEESSDIIYDINKVTERIKFSLRWTQDVQLLNRCSRLLFTFSEYLSDIISMNPEFLEEHRKPMNVWKLSKCR